MSEKGKWLELSVSVREVPESEVPADIRAKGKSPSVSHSYRKGWDEVFGKKEVELN